jgi:hypothetical protein
MAHVDDELRSLEVRLRLPALITSNLLVLSIHLKRAKIRAGKPSQDDAARRARKRICDVGSTVGQARSIPIGPARDGRPT